MLNTHLLYSLFLSGCLLILAACAQPVQNQTATTLPAEVTQTEEPEPTATSTPDIALNIDLLEGDPESGLDFVKRQDCYSCHVDELHPEWGPRFAATDELPGILERGEMRISSPDYEGKASTNQEYFIESVYLPKAYIVPGDWGKTMPLIYHQIIDEQDLANIIAWLASE
jgi:cytochrome c2